jgi:hypothetical protein
MRIYIAVLAGLLLALPVLADEQADRAQLIGKWLSEDSATQETWILESKGDSLRVTQSDGDKTIAEFECKPSGVECEGTDSGKKAKVTMYFNGSALVQLETRGSDVTKRRFALTGKPDMMDVEVIPLVGEGKTETLHLKRVSQLPAGQ